MWADNETDVDLLGFDYLVDGLVVALTEPRLLPVTIGVLGDWGSGKSSLMRIAAAELAAEPLAGGGQDTDDTGTEDGTAKSAYLTVPFSPWQYEDFEDVKVALMNTVLDAFELRFPDSAPEIGRLRGFVTRVKRWARRAGRAGSAAAPVAVPVLVQTMAPDTDPEMLKVVGAATKAVTAQLDAALAEPVAAASADSDGDEVTDVTQFRERFTTLVESESSINAVVVFVDDLDRCLPETVVDTLEAIRLFLNTPKTAYVLALNQGVVEAAIDSRYPDLKRADGAGLGRDYLEKMLQLKTAIPPLSAPEAETYANLLIAELHLDDTDFAKVVERTEENRVINGLAVAFNVGIAGDVLTDIPEAMANDLTWAANIMPVLGASLRGNPRRLKRFLNNLMLKHRGAARRKVELKLPELAKLMVLEDQYNSDFQKLFDWQLLSDGPSPQLAEAEDHARAPARPEAPPQSDSTAPARRPRRAADDAGGGGNGAPAGDADVTAWAGKVHIAEWLKLDPPLKAVDLRPYFTYSRDKLSFGVSASRLAPHLQLLLTQVQSDVEKARRAHYPTVAALEPVERARFIEALLDRVLRYPAGVALIAALEIAEQNPDVVDALCETLLRVPPASVPTTAGTLAVRRLPNGSAKANQVFDHWEASGNSALQTIVRTAREALRKKGAPGGNFRR